MATTKSKPKIIAVVGLTASGKSALAMWLAKEFNGEIICADSRTVYKGMDIGTAKPTTAEQKQVRHWGLDLVEPGQIYSAAKFKKYAQSAITDIHNRGKLPILVGGTGLYVDAVLYDFRFSPAGSERDPLNPRHLKAGVAGQRGQLLLGTLIVGLLPPDTELKRRIAARAKAIFNNRIVQETEVLVKKYGYEAVAGSAGIVYKISLRIIKGEISQQQGLELFKTADWQYARRQKTWFKRNEHIKWFGDADAAYKYIQKQLVNT